MSGQPALTEVDCCAHRAPLPEAQGFAERERIQDLILQYQPLVRGIARQIHNTLPAGVPIDLNDLVQAGFVGLATAARAFDMHSEVAFGVYARYRIRGEILDTLRRADPASRRLRSWQKRTDSVVRELSSALQRLPTDAEVCRRLGVDQIEAQDRNVALLTISLLAGYARVEGGQPDPAADPQQQPDAICLRRQAHSVLEKAIGSLPERYRLVISLYYSGDMTLKEIGHVLKIKESRVWQMHRGALEAMGRSLRACGIRCSADL